MRDVAILCEGGLSPQVRGKHIPIPDFKVFAGSIPAGTGETETIRLAHRLGRVYPRRYGGNHDDAEHGNESWGLSPQVRGKLTGSSACVLLRGSIPAGTGETRPLP